jgi:hypothetical protein
LKHRYTLKKMYTQWIGKTVNNKPLSKQHTNGNTQWWILYIIFDTTKFKMKLYTNWIVTPINAITLSTYQSNHHKIQQSTDSLLTNYTNQLLIVPTTNIVWIIYQYNNFHSTINQYTCCTTWFACKPHCLLSKL